MEVLKNVVNQIKTNDNVKQLMYRLKRKCLSNNSEIKKKLGINRFGDMIFGIISASNNFIDEQTEIIIENEHTNRIIVTTGNLDDLYLCMLEKVKTLPVESLKNILSIVSDTVSEYFGENGDVKKRLEFLPDSDKELGTLVHLKGKNVASPVERAVLSQNLLKLLGFNSTIKQSTITIDGHEEYHAYNIIRLNKKNYIYDCSLPRKLEDGRTSPIVGIISDEEYSKITNGSYKSGCKTSEMKNGVIYDSSFLTLSQQEKLTLRKHPSR